jgi:hypothetical protein
MYSRKKLAEDLPQEETKIWACTTEGCKGWMRDNFAFEYTPTCSICHSIMTSSTKMLPILENTNGDLKSLKKGTKI